MRCTESYQVRFLDHVNRKVKVIEGNLTRDNLRDTLNHGWKMKYPTSKSKMEDELAILRKLIA